MENVYINNPHSFDMLARPLSYWVFRRRPHLKYQYFFERFISGGGKFSFDFSETSFGRISGFKKLLVPFILVELLLWALLNRVPLRCISLKPPGGSVFIVFSYKGALEDGKLKRSNFNRASRIYWHLSHYMIAVKRKSDFIGLFKDKTCFLADSDVRSNRLFRKYFSGMMDQPLLIVPFVPAERFSYREELSLRNTSRIYASGTYHYLREGKDDCDEAIAMFGRNSHHYLRQEISTGKYEWIDCGQGDFADQKGVFVSSYFNRDLVKMFNQYAFVVCGDELNGLPAISNFEAMCCGALPIVHEDNYKGIGLEKGIHYLAHDGSITGLEGSFKNRPSSISRGLQERIGVRRILREKVDSSLAMIFQEIN